MIKKTQKMLLFVLSLMLFSLSNANGVGQPSTKDEISYFNLSGKFLIAPEDYPHKLRLYHDCPEVKLGCISKEEWGQIDKETKLVGTIHNIDDSVGYVRYSDIEKNKRARNKASHDPVVAGAVVGGLSGYAVEKHINKGSSVRARNTSVATSIAGMAVGALISNSQINSIKDNVFEVHTAVVFITLNDGRKARFEQLIETVDKLQIGDVIEIKQPKAYSNKWSFSKK